MTAKRFVPEVWIGKTAAGLSELARKVIPPRGHGGRYSHEEYQRMTEERTEGDLDLREEFDRSHIGFDDEPVEVEALLRQHPVISRALESSEQGQAVAVFSPGRSNTVELRSLVAHLIG